MGARAKETIIFMVLLFFWAASSNLSEEFVVTSQQLKEELQEASGVDQIFIPQKNQRFAESLMRTGKTQKNISVLCDESFM